MKYYDFKKAISIINESKDCLETASLGMHEDWFWTAETIFEDNEFVKDLNEDVLIGGINSSEWGTHTLQLCFKDGDEKMLPCYYGDGIEMSLGDKIERQIQCTSGCLSSVVQENIKELDS